MQNLLCGNTGYIVYLWLHLPVVTGMVDGFYWDCRRFKYMMHHSILIPYETKVGREWNSCWCLYPEIQQIFGEEPFRVKSKKGSWYAYVGQNVSQDKRIMLISD